MRLSVVFELLLVFLFLAFAAGRVIDTKNAVKNLAKGTKKTTVLRQGPPNRYCACTSRMCNCCRDFSLPVVPIKGPGCASIMYAHKDTMLVTMTFGERVLSNTTITGKNPKPVCMTLPGGISQFCGRIYGISRKGDQFRACLGLELRALDDIEAALRVSCFKFGPKGVRLESAPPVPAETSNKEPDDDDDDDYDLEDDDDLIGFGDDDDDGTSSEDNEVDSDSVDYTGFSVLGEDILGTLFSDDSSSSSSKKKKVNKKTAKPQIVAPKTTTTRRPIVPNVRRSTPKPVTLVKRPINKIKRPRPTVGRPQNVIKPSSTVVAPVQTTTAPSTVNLDKNIATVRPTTTTTETSPPTERMPQKEATEITVAETEPPITFTMTTQRMEVVKNEIAIPQTDLAKVEAVAAIAQQDVTSGVISSSSMTSEESEKPSEGIVALKQEKTTPSYPTESTTPYMSDATEKINSVKFVPVTIHTSSSAGVPQNEDDLLDKIVHTEIAANTATTLKNKITTQEITKPTTNQPQQQESEEESEDEEEEETEEEEEDTEGSNKVQQNVVKDNSNLKKQPQKDKPEEEEEEEEEEDDDDLLAGVLSDDDDNEEAEEEEEDSKPSQTSSKQPVEDEEEDDEEEVDILGESQKKTKPTKTSIKKKPSSDEEDDDEDDLLEVLGDDDDDDSDEEELEREKDKKKISHTTQSTTIRINKPTPVIQSFVSRKPLPTTEKVVEEPDQGTEKFTEKVIVYKKPSEKVTEKVIIYKEPETKVPEKIFIYKEPEGEKVPEKVIFYKEPISSVTEKFVIYQEPDVKATEKPISVIKEDKSSEENKEDDSEEEESEEESDEEETGNQTLVASISKPGFGNKYGEEHDLPESEDLDIEDSDDEINDFEEEDRKLKQGGKKAVTKSSAPTKPLIHSPQMLTLTDLIGQRKKFHEKTKDVRPISTSRTHRRMNLDRLLQV